MQLGKSNHSATTQWVDYMFISKTFLSLSPFVSFPLYLTQTHEGQPSHCLGAQSRPFCSVFLTFPQSIFNCTRRRKITIFPNRRKVSFEIERLITTLFPVNDKIWFFGLSTSDVSFKFQFFNISWVVTIMNTRWHRDFRNHLNLTGSFDESNRRNGRNIRLCNRNPFEK
jgi:hypothetical protein